MAELQLVIISPNQLIARQAANLLQGSPVLLLGVDGTQPSAGSAGRAFWATDTGKLYVDDGSVWVLMASSAHAGLTLGSDQHTEYMLADGTRAFTGWPDLPGSTPSGTLQPTPKTYVDSAVSGVKKPFQWGIGFISGAISTGDVFAKVPVSSQFSGATLRGWVATVRTAGSGTTTLNLQHGVNTISSMNLAATDTYKEVSGLTQALTSGDTLTVGVSVAGAHQGVGIWVFGDM